MTRSSLPDVAVSSVPPAGVCAVALAMALASYGAGAQTADVPARPAGDIEAGKRVFTRCAECHAVGPTARAAFGPQLNGIVGRPAASTPDFKYSAAMKNANIVWTETMLRAFIKSPNQVVPGNKMAFWGIGNDKEITNLLAYLRTFPTPQR